MHHLTYASSKFYDKEHSGFMDLANFSQLHTDLTEHGYKNVPADATACLEAIGKASS